MKNKIILIALLGVILIAVGVLMSKSNVGEQIDSSDAIVGDPLDTANMFYSDWLDALQSTTTDPYTAGLASSELLSESVKQYVADAQNSDLSVDPVICRSDIPPRIGAKEVFKTEDKAQYILLARGIGGVTPERALVDVGIVDNAWKITNISCVNGESAPEREFTFERTGHLLKNGEPPLDPDIWYIVFEEDGTDGHFAPLFFSETSECVSGGEVAACDPESFTNPSEATVKGEMSEVGVQVVRIEF